jgi:FixJ family two-component response regulator
MQGLDGVTAVEKALADGDPFAVAFIDVRMPPGIDGKETATRIRALDPDINLVIVTGYSDFSPIEISKRRRPRRQDLLHRQAVRGCRGKSQMATALGHRWQVDRELAATRRARREDRDLEEQKLELAANEARRSTWPITIR